jgi:RNA polymerase sigma-70 factor (ECF subfamily)
LEEIPSLEVHEEEDDNQDRTSMLEKALNKLPEDERALVTLFYLNESSVEEIHTITGLSKANVKIKLFRARKKMHAWVMQATEKIYN